VSAATTSCPICGSGRSLPFGVRDGYALLRCRACDHVAVANVPTPDELDRIYERYSYDERHLGAIPAFVSEVLDEVVATFAPYRRTGRLLDVGFGAGSLLAAARRAGWETHGIETSALAVRQAREDLLGDTRHGDFLTEPYPASSFDVIAIDGVLEHLIEPRRFVTRARDLLVPGGLLYVTVPHGRGLSARVCGAEWSVCAPPEHLHLFSRRSLSRLLSDAGFARVGLLTKGMNPYEILRRVRRTHPRDGGPCFDRVESSYALNARLTGSRIGRLIKGLANAVLNATRLGDNVVAYATKGPG
jgi:SAM-dependent methyltransferase